MATIKAHRQANGSIRYTAIVAILQLVMTGQLAATKRPSSSRLKLPEAGRSSSRA